MGSAEFWNVDIDNSIRMQTTNGAMGVLNTSPDAERIRHARIFQSLITYL